MRNTQPLVITFTAHGNSQFVVRDQVSAPPVIYCSLHLRRDKFNVRFTRKNYFQGFYLLIF